MEIEERMQEGGKERLDMRGKGGDRRGESFRWWGKTEGEERGRNGGRTEGCRGGKGQD